MSWSRRQFLAGMALGASSLSLQRRGWAAAPRRPRVLVQVTLGGGVDALLSTDPKTRSQADARIEIPYEEGEIVRGGQTAVAPFLAPLAPYLPRMAILNGVVCSTVAHKTGNLQIQQMRRIFPEGGRALGGTLGWALGQDRPFSDYQVIGGGVQSPPSPGFPVGRALVASCMVDSSHNLLARLSALAHDPRRADVQSMLEAELAGCRLSQRCLPLDVARTLLDRLSRVPLLPDAPRLNGGNGNLWRDALFLIEHRLCTGIYLLGPLNFDTHANNLQGQRENLERFLRGLLYFLGELDSRRFADGAPLADEVGLVISSELGRFPLLNEFQGKDHLPEVPAILVGPGLRPGQYGETDANLISSPISLATGHASSGRKDIVPNLDDLGTTILHWFGIEDAASLGYLGRRLDFLLA